VKELNHRDGIHPPRLVQLEAVLRAEAMTANGRGFRDHRETGGAFPADMITTEQAAAALGISPRHLRRRADELGGRKVGTAWMFDSLIISAAAAEQPKGTTDDRPDH
jgi:hypothetical protein